MKVKPLFFCTVGQSLRRFLMKHMNVQVGVHIHQPKCQGQLWVRGVLQHMRWTISEKEQRKRAAKKSRGDQKEDKGLDVIDIISVLPASMCGRD